MVSICENTASQSLRRLLWLLTFRINWINNNFDFFFYVMFLTSHNEAFFMIWSFSFHNFDFMPYLCITIRVSSFICFLFVCSYFHTSFHYVESLSLISAAEMVELRPLDGLHKKQLVLQKGGKISGTQTFQVSFLYRDDATHSMDWKKIPFPFMLGMTE